MPRVLSEPEYNALRDRVLAAAPGGLSEADFGRYIGPAMADAVGTAENSSAPLEGSALERAVSGAWKNLNPVTILSGLASLATHPLDTGGAILRAQASQFGKAADDYKQGRYSEMVGHTTAGALPLLGPAAAAAGERAGQGDVAGGVGEGAGLVAMLGATKPLANLASKGARAAIGAVRSTGAGADALDAIAQLADKASTSRMVEAIAPKVGPNKVRLANQAAKVAPDLARDADLGALSRAGLATKVESKLSAAEDALDTAADSRLVSQQVPTKPILDNLDAQIGKLEAKPLDASRPIPSVTSDAIRMSPIDKMRQYALKWMYDDMDNIRYVKRTFNDAGVGKGGNVEVVAGSRGAPIYDAIAEAGGSGTREAVTRAIGDVMNGNTEGKLRQAIVDVADKLVQGDKRTVRLMQTSGPDALDIMSGPDARAMQLGKDKPSTATVERQGRPIGESVQPQPSADELSTLQRIRNEVAKLGPVASYDSIRKIRQAWDQVAKVKYSPSLTQDFLKKQSEAAAAMKGTGAMRDALAAADPQTAAANADYSLYRTANDILKATEETEAARPRIGRRIMRVGGGMLVGEGAAGAPGAALGATLAVVLDAASNLGLTTKIWTARRLAQVADLVRSGNVGGAQQQLRQTLIDMRRPSAAAVVRGSAGPLGQIVGEFPTTAAADREDNRPQLTGQR